MGLQLKFVVVEEKNTICVLDLTGRLKPNNPGGYSKLTCDLSWIQTATIEAIAPGATTGNVINVFPYIPTIGDTALEILDGQVGTPGAGFKSGKWKFVFAITGVDDKGVPFTYSTYSFFVFTKKAVCCVDKLTRATANVPTAVNMKDERKKAAVEMRALLDDALWAISPCENFDLADKILQHINANCCDGC